MTKRNTLIALAVIYKGNWQEILKVIRTGDLPSENEMDEAVKSVKSNVLTFFDEEYPAYLKEMYMPPLVLFYYGDISLIQDPSKNLAVIGSRECSPIGAKNTKSFVSSLVHRYVIVSGLARGIDSIAHQEAINSGGKTIAVLGSGIDFCYPIRNEELYKIIKDNHLVISEYPGDTQPIQDLFPTRNRIISQISKGVLVTESTPKSGTSITVNYALNMSREVMCVPSSDLGNSGCNKTIKEGAFLVEDAEDVITIMG